MRMSEAEFLNRLNKAFPEKVIFAEQARLSVYLSLFVEIRRYARGTGVSSVQWLTDRGFIWKETGYVEPDMHNVDKCGPSPDYTAFELADYVFRAYPLAGEYQLTDAEDALLYQSASETVKKVLIDGGRTSVREDAVLVLETINLLKGWSSELADEETSGSLWNYIFLQYGFNPENSEAAANRLYNYFRGAIKGTLAHYKRFFAPEGTQRYYTSLLLHALAPKQSIESLYSILFDFYVKNLDFQYVTEDISYKVFTKGMRARWDSRVAKNDELQLRADAIFSGLQTLFKERPGYMAVLCDSIVKKMDAILRNEDTDLIDPDRNYWDTMVLEDTSDSIIVPVSGMAWQLELYIPLVRCALMGHNAFKIPGMIWHKSILHDEFVKLELPEGWSGQLMLGISPVPEVSPSYFELGNTLRAITAPQAEYDLWISLENIAGNHITRKITTIACKPTFAAPPIEVIDSTLHWQPEGNYVGDPESTFQVEVQRPGGSIDT